MYKTIRLASRRMLKQYKCDINTVLPLRRTMATVAFESAIESSAGYICRNDTQRCKENIRPLDNAIDQLESSVQSVV